MSLLTEHHDRFAYMYEDEKYIDISDREQSNRLSTYLSVTFKLKDTAEISSITYYQPKISDPSHQRLFNESSLQFQLYEKLRFSTTLAIIHDAHPPEGVEKTDTTLTNGLKWTF